jgi:hypothetical protein
MSSPEDSLTRQEIDERVMVALRCRKRGHRNMDAIRAACAFDFCGTVYRAMDRLYEAGRIDKDGKPVEALPFGY